MPVLKQFNASANIAEIIISKQETASILMSTKLEQNALTDSNIKDMYKPIEIGLKGCACNSSLNLLA